MTRPSASRPGSPSSIECWEVVSFPLRSSSSEVSRGSASRRFLSALGAIARSGRRALLVTGEESVAQVSLRAARLGGAESVEILAETELDVVCATLEEARPDVCVIDSVQTLHASALGSAPGSVGQVREAAGRLLRVAKEACAATILVGHVTKDGAVGDPRPRAPRRLRPSVRRRPLSGASGPAGDEEPLRIHERARRLRDDGWRPRRRCGSVGALRLHASRRDRSGCELRARGNAADPARDSGARHADRPRHAETRRNGVDPRRLAMIVAVLGRHAGVALASSDVFVNVAGGVKIEEPGADLAVALAIASAARGTPVRDGVAAFGEVGHGPPAPGGTGGTASRRVREDAYCDRSRARRDRDSWRSARGWCRDASRGDQRRSRGPRRPRSGRVDVFASGGFADSRCGSVKAM